MDETPIKNELYSDKFYENNSVYFLRIRYLIQKYKSKGKDLPDVNRPLQFESKKFMQKVLQIKKTLNLATYVAFYKTIQKYGGLEKFASRSIYDVSIYFYCAAWVYKNRDSPVMKHCILSTYKNNKQKKSDEPRFKLTEAMCRTILMFIYGKENGNKFTIGMPNACRSLFSTRRFEEAYDYISSIHITQDIQLSKCELLIMIQKILKEKDNELYKQRLARDAFQIAHGADDRSSSKYALMLSNTNDNLQVDIKTDSASSDDSDTSSDETESSFDGSRETDSISSDSEDTTDSSEPSKSSKGDSEEESDDSFFDKIPRSFIAPENFEKKELSPRRNRKRSHSQSGQ